MRECIPYYRPGTDLTCSVMDGVSAGQFVSIGSPMEDGLVKIIPTGAGWRPFGVAVTTAAAGFRVAVIRGPRTILPVIAGAAITAGVELQTDSKGRVIPQTDGIVVGRALDSASAAGDEVVIELL